MVTLWDWALFVWLPIFFLNGVLLKVLDALTDRLKTNENRSSPSLLLFGGIGVVVCALMFLLLSSISPSFAALHVGIILGVFAGGKVDNPLFSFGAVIYGSGVILLRLYWPIDALWSVTWVGVFSTIDEWGHSWMETHAQEIQITALTQFFFKYRLTLKIGVILLVAAGLFEGVAAVGLWLFDIGYVITDFLMVRR